jgi:membrane-bound inhibitor of C-type lysozyme
MRAAALTIAVSAAGLLVAGCATTPASPPSRSVHFACDNGSSLSVLFENSQATVTPAGGKPLVLPQSITADGFLYMTPQHSLRGKGNEVTWTVGRMIPTTCKESGR